MDESQQLQAVAKPMPSRRWYRTPAVIVTCCALPLVALATRHKRDAPVEEPTCQQVAHGFGQSSPFPIRAEEVASGLEAPWAIAFLPGGDLLVTERAGRLRRIHANQLVREPVANVGGPERTGGLRGIALHPLFAKNRLFYLYRAGSTGRVERWRLSADARAAALDRIIIDGIGRSAAPEGGRLRFGPDGMLYVGTGAGTEDPASAQDVRSLTGKLLRVTPDGAIPADNPFPGSAAFLIGLRNSQGFDWRDRRWLWLVDQGPGGELGGDGHDEVNVAQKGDNLGWPELRGCATRAAMVTPWLTWQEAAVPSGAAIYTGRSILEWRGSLMVATLGAQHLHRVAFDAGRVAFHHVYLVGGPPSGYGRLREVIMGPDHELYVTTSNCDGSGTCPPTKDQILRITR